MSSVGLPLFPPPPPPLGSKKETVGSLSIFFSREGKEEEGGRGVTDKEGEEVEERDKEDEEGQEEDEVEVDK